MLSGFEIHFLPCSLLEQGNEVRNFLLLEDTFCHCLWRWCCWEVEILATFFAAFCLPPSIQYKLSLFSYGRLALSSSLSSSCLFSTSSRFVAASHLLIYGGDSAANHHSSSQHLLLNVMLLFLIAGLASYNFQQCQIMNLSWVLLQWIYKIKWRYIPWPLNILRLPWLCSITGTWYTKLCIYGVMIMVWEYPGPVPDMFTICFPQLCACKSKQIFLLHIYEKPCYYNDINIWSVLCFYVYCVILPWFQMLKFHHLSNSLCLRCLAALWNSEITGKQDDK